MAPASQLKKKLSLKKLINGCAILLFIAASGCIKQTDDCKNIDSEPFYITGIGIATKNLSQLDPNKNILDASLFDYDHLDYHQADSIGFLTAFSGEPVSLHYNCDYSMNYQNPIKSITVIYRGDSTRFNDAIYLVPDDTISNLFTLSDENQNILSSSIQSLPDLQHEVGETFLMRFSESNRDSIILDFDIIATLSDSNLVKHEDLFVKLLPSK